MTAAELRNANRLSLAFLTLHGKTLAIRMAAARELKDRGCVDAPSVAARLIIQDHVNAETANQ